MIKEKLSGIFIFISFILTLYSYFLQNDFLIIASLFVWLSFAFIFPTLKDKKILLILMFFSFMAYTICLYNDFKIDYIKVFTVNQYLLTLLIGVVFLRLIAIPKKEKNIVFPKGKNSFIKTYLGVHLFGSVINLSSLILVADKMYKKSPLTNAQIVLLTRSFASDAYWSPFFVSFAAATTYAPNLNTSLIMLNGIILAVFAFVITYIDVTRNKEFDIQNFYGYPLSLENLYLPVILATLVLVTNHFYPDAKVIILVSLFSISMVFVLLPFKTSLNEARKLIKKHILYELPKMKSELSLFLVAGVFGVLVGSILIGLNLSLPFKIFDWQIASILLLIFIFLAFIGVHPIITIAIIGDYLNGVNHTLLALTFLMAWSTTVSTSPFSGLNMTIVARYDFSSKEIFRLNIFYALKMYLICILCLYILSKYLNL
jgi:hypothetical protein